jgi:hypothetical protein
MSSTNRRARLRADPDATYQAAFLTTKDGVVLFGKDVVWIGQIQTKQELASSTRPRRSPTPPPRSSRSTWGPWPPSRWKEKT